MLVLSSLRPPPGLVQPRDLSFSEVAPRSFRASWKINADDVESYLVQFRPTEGEDAHYVSMSVPGNVHSALLPHLSPLTRYQVSVSAQYAKGTSLPVTGYSTTSEGWQVLVYKKVSLNR